MAPFGKIKNETKDADVTPPLQKNVKLKEADRKNTFYLETQTFDQPEDDEGTTILLFPVSPTEI